MKNIGTLEIADRQLAESQLRLQTILRLSPVGIGITRLSDGAIIEFNDALLAIIGYQRTEVTGRTSAELGIWSDPEQRSRFFSEIASGTEIREIPMGIRRKDGEFRQGLVSASMVQLDGKAHLIANLRDVTDENIAEEERTKTEIALRESEERYRKVVEDQTELIGRYRPDGTMVFVNEVYCRFFGKTVMELSGRTWHPVVHPDDIEMIEKKLSLLSPSNPVVTIENRVYAADGREHWMQFINRGLFDTTGSLKEIQSVGRDISARKLAECELAASRAHLRALFEANDHLREEQRKEIAREIHDQLGAHLTAIGFRVDALNHRIHGNVELAPEFALIKSLVSQATQAARNICDSLRPPALDDLGLIPTCRWYLQNWSGLVGVPAKGRFGGLTTEPSKQMCTDLFRIFQELLTNVARHSGASSVRVSISNGANILRLRVADDGCGFGKEQKTPGFGLAGIQERIARHGGGVSIVSGPSGSVVVVTVPLHGAP